MPAKPLSPRVRGLLALAYRRARARRRIERQRMLDYFEDLQDEADSAAADEDDTERPDND